MVWPIIYGVLVYNSHNGGTKNRNSDLEAPKIITLAENPATNRVGRQVRRRALLTIPVSPTLRTVPDPMVRTLADPMVRTVPDSMLTASLPESGTL